MTKERYMMANEKMKEICHVQQLISIFDSKGLIEISLVGDRTATIMEKEKNIVSTALEEYRQNLLKEFKEI